MWDASFSRRMLLSSSASTAGAALFAPFLSMARAADAKPAQQPKRFVFFVQGNGISPGYLRPASIANPKASRTELLDQPLTELELPEPISPLSKFRERMTIIQGLSNRIAYSDHSCRFGALGAYSAGRIMGATIDSALASAVPGIFPHLGLGVNTGLKMNRGPIYYNISASGRDKPLPTIMSPRVALENLFGSIREGAGRQAFETKTNVLDFLTAESKQTAAQLRGAERERFAAYLEALEALGKRQQQLAQVSKQLAQHAPAAHWTEKFNSESNVDQLEAQFELGAAALLGGLTNVLTLSSGAGDNMQVDYQKLLGFPVDIHGIGHGGSFGEKSSNEIMTLIRQFNLTLLAGLVDKLAAVPEGDGTMLDNTLIVYLSDFGDSHHPSAREWPLLLIGNMQKKFRVGRYLEFPWYGKQGHRTLANLYCSLLHAAGTPRDTFGVADPGLRDLDQSGPLGELAS